LSNTITGGKKEKGNSITKEKRGGEGTFAADFSAWRKGGKRGKKAS